MPDIQFKIVGEETFFSFRKDPKGIERILVHVQLQDGLIKSMAFDKSAWINGDKQRLINDWLSYRVKK